MTTAFGEAISVIDGIEQIVNEHIYTMQQYADKAFQDSLAVVNKLMGAPLGIISDDEDFLIPPPPAVEFDDGDFDDALRLQPFPEVPQAGTIPEPAFDSDYIPAVGAPPTFDPSIDSLNIPNPPPPIDTSGLPAHPAIDMTVDLPVAPNPAMPSMGELVPINVPEYTFPEIPPFDATAPEFMGTPIGSVMQWTEPVYHIEILDEVMVQVRKFLGGGTGMHPAVEKALFERAYDNDQLIVDRQVHVAYDEYSARGYTMPPGALTARVDGIRQEAMLKAQATNREVLIKAAEWEIENLKFAVQQGIACEALLINMFLNMAQRLFEASKLRIESEIAVYNAQVALYNAQMVGYRTEAEVYKITIDAMLAELEAYKAQIEGEKAKAELNQQQVQVYVAQLEAVQKQINIYTAQMEGAKIESDIIKNHIEIYKADIEAYATKIGAEKVVFEAYEAQIKGEAAKAGILESEARAFASTIEGYKAGADVEIARSRNVIERNKLHIDKFTALIEQDKARMQSQLGAWQAAVSRQQAYTAAYQANASAFEAQARLTLQASEANSRNFIAYMEIQLKKYDAYMARLLQKSQIAIDGLKAAGSISSSLSAGAMAAMHVSSSLQGGGTVGATEQNSLQTSHQHIYQEK